MTELLQKRLDHSLWGICILTSAGDKGWRYHCLFAEPVYDARCASEVGTYTVSANIRNLSIGETWSLTGVYGPQEDDQKMEN